MQVSAEKLNHVKGPRTSPNTTHSEEKVSWCGQGFRYDVAQACTSENGFLWRLSSIVKISNTPLGDCTVTAIYVAFVLMYDNVRCIQMSSIKSTCRMRELRVWRLTYSSNVNPIENLCNSFSRAVCRLFPTSETELKPLYRRNVDLHEYTFDGYPLLFCMPVKVIHTPY